MKITPQQYADALYESLKDADRKKADRIIREFARVLVESNRTSWLADIARRFEEAWNREKGIVKAEIISAGKLDQATGKSLRDFLAARSGSKHLEINWTVDRGIVGGAVLKYGSKMLDASLGKKLRDLKERISS